MFNFQFLQPSLINIQPSSISFTFDKVFIGNLYDEIKFTCVYNTALVWTVTNTTGDPMQDCYKYIRQKTKPHT
jgi:hypothetical protein